MKGFKDKNKKFHPINQKKGMRKSRDQKAKTQGVRLRRPNLKEEDIIVIPNQGQIMDAFGKLKQKSKWEKNIDESNSYNEGFDRGIAFAESAFDDIGQLKIGMDISKLDFGADEFELGFTILENKDDVKEFIRQSAFKAEESDRDFSPFEVTANELHDREFDEDGKQISDAFDAFEDGIGEAVDWYVSWVFENNEDLVK